MSQWLWRLISYSKYMSTISCLGFFSIPPSLLDPGWERSLYLKYFSRCSRGKKRYSESQTDSKGFCLRETHHASAQPKQVLWYLLASTGHACIILPQAWAQKAVAEWTEMRRRILLPFQRENGLERGGRGQPREHPVLHLWHFGLWWSVSLDGQPKRRCWEIRWWIQSGQGELGVPLRHWSDGASWGC